MRLEQFFHNISNPVVVCQNDEQLTVTYLNGSARKLFAAPKWEPGTAAQVLLGISAGEFAEFFENVGMAAGQPGFSVILNLPAGKKISALLRIGEIELDGEEYISICIEIMIDSQMDVLHTVTDNIEDIVYAADIDTDEILFANRAMAQLIGASQITLVGRKREELLAEYGLHTLKSQPAGELFGPDGKIIKRNYSWEFYDAVKQKWFLVRDALIEWPDGRDAHLQTATDITSQKRHEERLEYAASIDMMTGTYNREWGRALIQGILNGKVTDQVNSLVFIDIDHLKLTNDRFGHEAGDKVILNIVELIRANTRRSDMLCRWGGDEFVMVVRANGKQAGQVFAKIRHLLEQQNAGHESCNNMSFSYGVVEMEPDRYRTAEEVVAEADRRMYENKRGLFVHSQDC